MTPAEAAVFFRRMAAGMQRAEERGIGLAVRHLAEAMRERLGHYEQDGQPAWPELTAGTQAGRVRAGYTPNDPLLASGALRAAIGSEVEGNQGVAGVRSGGEEPNGADVGDVAIFMENGTVKAPARPFVGPTAFAEAEHAVEIAGKAIAKALEGEVL